MTATEFTFDPRKEHESEVAYHQRIIGEAVGAASACWENLAGAGMFQSDHAAAVVNALLVGLGIPPIQEEPEPTELSRFGLIHTLLDVDTLPDDFTGDSTPDAYMYRGILINIYPSENGEEFNIKIPLILHDLVIQGMTGQRVEFALGTAVDIDNLIDAWRADQEAAPAAEEFAPVEADVEVVRAAARAADYIDELIESMAWALPTRRVPNAEILYTGAKALAFVQDSRGTRQLRFDIPQDLRPTFQRARFNPIP